MGHTRRWLTSQMWLSFRLDKPGTGSQVRLPAPSHEVINQGALGGGRSAIVSIIRLLLASASAWDQRDIRALSYQQRGRGKQRPVGKRQGQI